MSPKKVVIIGGGPGGYVAGIRAAQLGANVTLVEKDKIGGTCLNRGCIPTKALLHDAKLFRSLRRSSVFHSLSVQGMDLLGPMMDRKTQVVKEMVKGIELLLESHRVAVKTGRGDLLGINKVALFQESERKETIEADVIILAPGSRSRVLPNIVPDGDRIITSNEALEIEKIPKDLAIIGGGYIGIEFATLFSALGVKVTVIEVLEDLLPGLEGELVRNLRRVLEREDITVFTQSSVEDIRYDGDQLKLSVRTPQGAQELVTEKMLLSVGRAPSLDLNFSSAGVEILPSGIRVDRRMRTTMPSIYAIGDAIGGLFLAHVASEQGMVAAENAMGMDREMEDRPVPLCVFSHPEIAAIGLTEKEAKARGEVKIGRFPFRSNPRALISGETDGLIKVVADRETDEILGVHIIGPEASTLISVVTPFLERGVKVKDFSRFVQAHPTLPEALKEAALDVDGMAIHLPKPLRRPTK